MKKIITTITLTVFLGMGIIIFNQLVNTDMILEGKTINGTKKVVYTNYEYASKRFEKENNDTKEQVETPLTEKKIATLMDDFMDTLVQDIHENNQVLHYNSKEELLKAFDAIAKRDVVQPFVDFYYIEEADKLYVVPTETPAWFVSTNKYEREDISEQEVMITQANVSDLHGEYTIKVNFEKVNQEWKIAKISYE
ncbi:hypothetical protein ACFOZ1_05140 [Gracilibacillus marinus]|uniref:DUF3993 domain-containing protein n=1 Tax=Gracilibacillus marinus TaxID=630535 RepID=A0ABV8VVU2_9BACI